VSDKLHTPAALPSRKNPGTHWIWDCSGPRAGLDVLDYIYIYIYKTNYTVSGYITAYCIVVLYKLHGDSYTMLIRGC